MTFSDKTEYKYTIETSNDNAQGVFKVRIVLRSDNLNISKTLQEANDIKIEEQKMSALIAELVGETYTELKERGFKTEAEPKTAKPSTTPKKDLFRPESEIIEKSLLLDQ